MSTPGTVVASTACHDCGNRCQIKLNKNCIGYYYCDCGSHHRYNRQKSYDLTEKYQRMYGKGTHEPAANDNQPAKQPGRVRTTGANDNEAPAEAPEETPAEAGAGADTPTGDGDTGERQPANDNGKPDAVDGHGGQSDTGDYFDDLYG